MKIFDFRLQKVLEYRRLVEGWAKDAYLDARVARLEAETAMHGIRKQREILLTGIPRTLDEHQAQERRLHLLDDQEAQQKIVVDVLLDEEAAALHEWTQKKQDVAALEKLHDRAYDEWQTEMNREEQAFLDEWSTSRRAA